MICMREERGDEWRREGGGEGGRGEEKREDEWKREGRTYILNDPVVNPRSVNTPSNVLHYITYVRGPQKRWKSKEGEQKEGEEEEEE